MCSENCVLLIPTSSRSKETQYSVKRDLVLCQKRPSIVSAKVAFCAFQPRAGERVLYVYVYIQIYRYTFLDIYIHRYTYIGVFPFYLALPPLSHSCFPSISSLSPPVSFAFYVSDETQYSVKRDLVQCQKRPSISSLSPPVSLAFYLTSSWIQYYIYLLSIQTSSWIQYYIYLLSTAKGDILFERTLNPTLYQVSFDTILGLYYLKEP